MSLFYSAGLGNAIPDDQLDHRYPTDEGSGSTVADVLGSLDSTTNATWVTGDGGKGDAYLNYDGVDDATYHEDTSNTPFDGDTQTWMGWINPDSLESSQAIFAESTPNSDNSLIVANGEIGFGTGEIGLWVNNADGGSNITIATSAITTSSWQFWAFTLDLNNTEAAFYFADSADSSVTQVGTQNYDQGLEYTVSTVSRGARPDGSGGWQSLYDGQDDHPATNVGTALSQSVIDDYFNATKGDYQ